MASNKHRQTAVISNESTDGGEASNGRGLLKERAYAEIKRRILSSAFTTGGFLAERQLASQLGMSKTPIRAALERLELEGFVTISPQQGVVVRDLSVRDIADQYETRTALEGFVVRTLAGRLPPAQVERLRANLAAQEANRRAGDIGRGIALDTEFHLLFFEFLGNQEMLRVMRRLREKIHRVISEVFTLNPERMAGSYEEHCAIADAVLRGDGTLAARRIEDHLEVGKQMLLSPRRTLPG